MPGYVHPVSAGDLMISPEWYKQGDKGNSKLQLAARSLSAGVSEASLPCLR